MEKSRDSEEENEEAGTCYDFTKKTWRDDVTFLVEDQRLYATRAVLAMASPVFEVMFGTNFKERHEEEVPLPGKKFEDFEEFLNCIYPKSRKKIDEHNVHKVLLLADEYDAKSLIKECKRFLNDYLMDGLTPTQEVMFCHGLATRHKFQGLRDVCATRLSAGVLKEIEYTKVGISDTDTLLQIHKDILGKQCDTLEEIRTELVNLYLDKDLTDFPQTPNLSEAKGAIIKFKPNIHSLDGHERKYSNPVRLWDIDIRVRVYVTKKENENFLTIALHSVFPEGDTHSVCLIDAKVFLMRTGMGRGPPRCFNVKNTEFSKKDSSWGFDIVMEHLSDDGFVENGTINIVVYLSAKKPFVPDQPIIV